MDSHGFLVYPHVFQLNFEFHGGKKISPQTDPQLTPHHAIASHTFVILRGPVVRAVAVIERITGTIVHTYVLQTPALKVRLVPGGAPPAISVSTSPVLQATIPGDAASSNRRLFSFQFWICGVGDVVTSTGGTTWVLAQADDMGTYRFAPACTVGQPVYWGLAAAYLNGPVASIERCTEPAICCSTQEDMDRLVVGIMDTIMRW
jgi:hypothetical protein